MAETRVTVQYRVPGVPRGFFCYGEFVAKSDKLSEQEMVDKMHAESKPGVSLRFMNGNGIIVPSGFTGDSRKYIPAKSTI